VTPGGRPLTPLAAAQYLEQAGVLNRDVNTPYIIARWLVRPAPARRGAAVDSTSQRRGAASAPRPLKRALAPAQTHDVASILHRIPSAPLGTRCPRGPL
jgi:hypothetical protein